MGEIVIGALMAAAATLFMLIVAGGGDRSSASEPEPDAEPEPTVSCAQAAKGLSFEPHGAGFRRRVNERVTLELSSRRIGRRVGERVTCRAKIQPPLGPRFEVKPYDGHQTSDLSLGHEFDLRFVALTDAPGRVLSLLGGPIAAGVLALDRAGVRVELSPRSAELTLGDVTELDQFRMLVRGAERLARALVDGEARLRSAVPYAIVARVWLGAARTLGGSFDREARVLAASTASGNIRAELHESDDSHWTASLTFELKRALSPEFSLASGPAGDGDPRTGDDELDARFSLTTDDPVAVQRVLDADARARLVELGHLVSAISVTHEGIDVEVSDRYVVEDDAVQDVLAALVKAGEALASVSADRSAYR